MLADDLDRLAALDPQDAPVLSLYLDTGPDDTGRRTFDLFIRKQLPDRLSTYAAGSDERSSFEADTARIEQFLADELEPSTRGVAIIACHAAGLFEALQLDVRLENLLVVSDRPHLYPLARVQDQYPRYAAVLADTNQARIFVFSTGRQENEVEVQGQKTKQVKVGGWSQARYQRHVENFHLQHVKEVVDVLDRVVRDEQIAHVVLAGDEVVIPLIREQLPKHLEERIVDVVRLDQRTPAHEVLARTLEVLQEKDAETDEQVVEELVGEYRRGGLAIVGAEATLAALKQGQVDTLVLAASPDLIADADDLVRHRGDATPAATITEGLAAMEDNAAAAVRNGTPTEQEAPEVRVAGDLVALAHQTAARLRFIENPDLLSPFGGVGATLRFAI